ncbi:MAG: hypothetical protein ABEJ31_12905 [Haloarculaceae archaeon]
MTSGETQLDRPESHVFGNVQQATATIGGAVLALLGLAGFVLAGSELWLFGVTALQNIAYLATGLLGVGTGTVAAGRLANVYNESIGLLYGGLVVLELVAPALTDAWLATGVADLGLYLVLASIFGGIGFLIERE